MPRQINDRLEILSRTPSWFTRSGSTVLLLIISLILFGTYLIKYPDTVDALATVTTVQLPAPIRARQSGYLEKLMIEEGQEVSKGQVLGVLESTANFESVVVFAKNLEKLKGDLKNSQIVPFPNIDNLGSLSKNYNNVSADLEKLRRHLTNPLRDIQIRKNKIEIDRAQEMIQQSTSQLEALKKDQEINDHQYRRDSSLYRQKVMPLQQFEESQKKLSVQLQAIKELESNIQINIEILNGLMLQGREILVQKDEDAKSLMLTLLQSIELTEADLRRWDQDFVLRSGIDGHLSFFRLLDENQYVNSGDELMIVLPNEEEIFAVCSANLAGAGKIEIGQEVQIRLNSFPYTEYGFVEGQVQSISEVSRDDSYLVKVALSNGLTTNYGQVLDFNQEMSGQALIITEELRLIDRFFNRFKFWLN